MKKPSLKEVYINEQNKPSKVGTIYVVELHKKGAGVSEPLKKTLHNSEEGAKEYIEQLKQEYEKQLKQYNFLLKLTKEPLFK